MQNDDNGLLLQLVDERNLKFAEVSWLRDKIAKIVLACNVLYVFHNFGKNVHAGHSRSQFLVESCGNDSFKSCHNCAKFVFVRCNLSYNSFHTELKSLLKFNYLKFVTNVVNHLIQFVHVL